MITRLDLMLFARNILGFILLLCKNPIFFELWSFFDFWFRFSSFECGGRVLYLLFWHRPGWTLYGLFP